MPETAPRAVLYLRQSTHREESISLELQETAGRDYCERMGYEVVAVEADPGISGRTWNRPAVKRVMSMVDDGRADVIVLWKWSRLSRSRRDWAVAADQVEMAGGRIESSTEAIDVATSTGRLARGMMTEFAAFESERIGDGWKESHARRVKSGRPANGKARWGYLYDAAEKVHVPDPDVGPIVTEVYRRYVAGESVYSLVRWLNLNGHLTAPGYGRPSDRSWSDHTLRRVLDSGFAAGLFSAGGQLHEGVHVPLIDRDTWDAFQAARVSRRVVRGAERSTYLLSGMVRCVCGGRMSGGQFGNGRVAKFRCARGKERGTHDGGYATMSLLEDQVMDWVRDLAAGLDDASDDALRAQAATTRRRADAASLAREASAAEDQLLRATRQHLSGVIPETAYVVIRDELEAQVAMLRERHLLATVDSRRGPAMEIARDLVQDWDLLSVEHRRGALRQLIATVRVTTGRPRCTVEIVPVWAGTEGEHGH